MRIYLSLFENVFAKKVNEVVGGLEGLVETVRKTTARTKDDLPLLKFARFGKNADPKTGSLRTDQNLIECTGVEGDYDGEQVSFDEAVERLTKANINAVVYTTGSHTREKPRWRVLAPFSRELKPSERAHMVGRLNGALGGILATESWTLSQSYFYGRAEGVEDFRVEIVDGEPIDLLDELDLIAIGKPNGAATGGNGAVNGHATGPFDEVTLINDIVTGASYHQSCTRLLGRWARNGVPFMEAEARLFFAFDQVAPELRDARWTERRADVPRTVEWIYGKDARKKDNSGTELENLINEFNEQFAVVNEAGKVIIYEQTMDHMLKRKVIVRLTFPDFKRMYQNRKIKATTQSGKSIIKPASELWLDSPNRRQYLKGVVFDPTGRQIPGCWNLWNGYGVEPQLGNWSLLYNHIKEIICGGNSEIFEYLLNWIARMFQFPDKPGEVAVVLRGKKGVGKGILFVNIIKAWGSHGIHILDGQHLTGRFNAHLRDCVALFADEAFYAGNKQHESVLKGIITEPTIPIEGKYQNVVSVPNMLHIMLASNADWAIPASTDERRYLMLDVPDTKAGDIPYFSAISGQMKNGGLAAMIWDMLHRDISKFEVRNIPGTEALIDQKFRSLDDLNRWWLDVLDRGFVWKSRHGASAFQEWTDTGYYSTEILHASYLQWCGSNRVNYPASRESLGRRMVKWGYQQAKLTGSAIIGEAETTTKFDDPVIRKDRPYGYKVGGLEDARENFEKALKLTCDHWHVCLG